LRATYPFGFDVVPFDTPGRLNVWLSSDCNKQVLIWQSPIISNEEWKKFEFKFSTDSIRSFDALVLEADYADQNTKKFGNVLVDLVNIEEMNLKLAPASICAGGEKRFERPSIIDSIYWKGWGSNQTLLIRNEGRYPARLVSGQCIVFDTLVVKSVFPLTVTSPKDTSLCVFEEWIIDEKTPFTNYVWDNGADSSSFKVTKPGVYRLEITNDCNSIKKEFNVNFRNQCCDIEAPNIFTPNGDRINDTFELVSSSTLVTFMLRIFNRWGDEVFVTNNLQQYWNGMVNGKEASTGVYFWTVEVNCLRGTNVRSTMHRGTITVAR
jgi:gliding motility-associated-like protein